MSPSRPYSVKSLMIVGAVCLVPAMTGCVQFGNPLPDPVEYACTWTNDAGDKLILASDGSAEIAVSGTLLRETLTRDDYVDGEKFETDGRWQIGNGLTYRDFRGDPAVRILFETSEGPDAWTVSADRRGGELVLLAPETDPDEYTRVVFTSSDCLQDVLDQNG